MADENEEQIAKNVHTIKRIYNEKKVPTARVLISGSGAGVFLNQIIGQYKFSLWISV